MTQQPAPQTLTPAPPEILDWLRAQADGTRAPTITHYRHNRPPHFPHHNTLVNRHGSWKEIAAQAGLTTDPEGKQGIADALAWLRDHAVNGIIPSHGAYERNAPASLPSGKRLYERFGSWGDVAAACGLAAAKSRPGRKLPAPLDPAPAPAPDPDGPVTLIAPPPLRLEHGEPPPPPPPPPPAARLTAAAQRRAARLDEIKASLRRLATDGHAPTMRAWDQHRPLDLPRAVAILDLYAIRDWAALAKLAGLRPTKRPK